MANFFGEIFKRNKKELNEEESLKTKKLENQEIDEQKQEIETEKEKLNNNFKELQEEIKDFGTKEELDSSLEKNPGLANSIFEWIKKIGASSFAELLKKKEVFEDSNNEKEKTRSPRSLINYGETIIKMTCKNNFEVDGDDQLKKFKEEHPDEKFIFTASHNNNNDVPALLKTFGEDFDLQITGNELFFEKAKYLAQNIGVRTIFGDHFTRLGQKESSDKKEYGVLRPENFIELDKKMAEGRTPWIAAHSFSADGGMRKVDNGALIEAYRQNAYLIPSALEITGGSKRMQGVGEIAKNLKDGSGAKYHVGEPYKPEPLPDGLNIDIINQVIAKRQNGEVVSDEEFENFKKVNRFLSTQSEKLGQIIAAMLPEEQRGYYKDKINNIKESV